MWILGLKGLLGRKGGTVVRGLDLPLLWRAAQISALNPSVSLLLVLSFATRDFLQVFRFPLS